MAAASATIKELLGASVVAVTKCPVKATLDTALKLQKLNTFWRRVQFTSDHRHLTYEQLGGRPGLAAMEVAQMMTAWKAVVDSHAGDAQIDAIRRPVDAYSYWQRFAAGKQNIGKPGALVRDAAAELCVCGARLFAADAHGHAVAPQHGP